MSSPTSSQPPQKRTPRDVSEFEREQLRFFLSREHLGITLATVNPSVAWLPILRQMNLLQDDTQLVDWIERNFVDAAAIKEVVANLSYFSPETANFLESRLDAQANTIAPVLLRCWQLIIRHIRRSKSILLRHVWFEIQRQIQRGDQSPALLDRLAQALQPKLRLSSRLFPDPLTHGRPESPFDLMSIEFEVEDGLLAEDVLQAWPSTTAAAIDIRLITRLIDALATSLEDATDVGVEGENGFGLSDSDVPSVAQHVQNAHRAGFQEITRVIAELWLRILSKEPSRALAFLKDWQSSPFRLIRRLALFGSGEPTVEADVAADGLISLPLGDLFLASSSVEVFRLVKRRWQDFNQDQKRAILHRFCEGPPRARFRDGPDIDRAIDQCRFDILGEMERDGLYIGDSAKSLLTEIRMRWPNLTLRPSEQAGFHIWHTSDAGIVSGEGSKLAGIPPTLLVAAAKAQAASKDILGYGEWDAMCLNDPDCAVRGLAEAAKIGDWPFELWRTLLLSRKGYTNPDTEQCVAQLLSVWPCETFAQVAPSASSWLEEHAKTLSDAPLWDLWDRIADSSLGLAEGGGDG